MAFASRLIRHSCKTPPGVPDQTRSPLIKGPNRRVTAVLPGLMYQSSIRPQMLRQFQSSLDSNCETSPPPSNALAHSQTIQPPAIPLAVRSPYVQAYLAHTSTSTPNNSVQNWPNFWTTKHTLGWCGLLRVDNASYLWQGDPKGLTLNNNATLNNAILESYQVTPTRTIFNLTAGNMAINITFLSPIESDDLLLQSFPFTYIFLEASSTDGNSHSLQVYEDISGEWISFNANDIMQWNTTTSNSIIYHEAQRSPPEFMTELNNMTEDGAVYHVTSLNEGNRVTYQSSQDTLTRSAFLNNGTLANTQDTTFRAIQDRWPVLAFCNDLGIIKSTSSPVVWAIGVVRNPNIVYTRISGNQNRIPYFFTKYNDVPTAMLDFMNNASDALNRAIALDEKITSDASNISSEYVDLVSLASRQVMAGMEITVGKDSNQQVNESDILIFMKDIGNSQRTNPVETLYAAFPAILYINLSWAGYLLEPLLQFESSPLYADNFAAGDLGSNFPSAFGNDNPDPFSAMEYTAEMLIMVWAHASFSGDGSLLSLYYSTLREWTEWLIEQHPSKPDDATLDGLSNPNMTNLAISGILAIRAMAKISEVVGEADDHNNYLKNATSLVSQWQILAGSSGHLTTTYNDLGSWALIYNLYADKLLRFNLVDSSIYDNQTSWYSNFANSASSSVYGLQFEGSQKTAMSHWTLFTAGTVTDNNTRDSLISGVYTAASNRQSFIVFPTTYSITNGSLQTGAASPAQGAMYALLALNLPNKTVSATQIGSGTNGSQSKKSNTGAIAGGVIGGVAFIAILALAVFLYRRYTRKIIGLDEDEKSSRSFFSILFGSKQVRSTPREQPLDQYHIEPYTDSGSQPRPSTSGYTTSSVPLSPESALPRNAGKNRQGPGSSVTALTSSEAGSSTVAAGLREEVQNLRREMEEMRMRAQYGPSPGSEYGPPPEYV
ncbi:hypothetical protein GYMLUDRAFT_265647 [Collybiopsis luxurians FD-317 M1]|uniref:DUF1793-domain-containing protein n=1 Tax=Collybiopsis luxurians FD-317 M1 TaxID=944289 RepID=A0A0D0BC19_9AGAR|nr:hypothetical protein GYMLUDRAFT_265647 [Collybiopsis luxurians FD-317 M1]